MKIHYAELVVILSNQKLDLHIQGSIKSKSYWVGWIDPKIIFNRPQTPKIVHWGAKKNPELRLKLEVKIEVCIENKSWESIRIDLKTAFEPQPNHQKKPIGAPKSQKWPQNQVDIKVRIQGSTEIKLFSCISRPKKTFWTLPQPQKKPIWAQQGQLLPQN